jgi:hypothetical protein
MIYIDGTYLCSEVLCDFCWRVSKIKWDVVTRYMLGGLDVGYLIFILKVPMRLLLRSPEEKTWFSCVNGRSMCLWQSSLLDHFVDHRAIFDLHYIPLSYPSSHPATRRMIRPLFNFAQECRQNGCPSLVFYEHLLFSCEFHNKQECKVYFSRIVPRNTRQHPTCTLHLIFCSSPHYFRLHHATGSIRSVGWFGQVFQGDTSASVRSPFLCYCEQKQIITCSHSSAGTGLEKFHLSVPQRLGPGPAGSCCHLTVFATPVQGSKDWYKAYLVGIAGQKDESFGARGPQRVTEVSLTALEIRSLRAIASRHNWWGSPRKPPANQYLRVYGLYYLSSAVLSNI